MWQAKSEGEVREVFHFLTLEICGVCFEKKPSQTSAVQPWMYGATGSKPLP